MTPNGGTKTEVGVTESGGAPGKAVTVTVVAAGGAPTRAAGPAGTPGGASVSGGQATGSWVVRPIGPTNAVVTPVVNPGAGDVCFAQPGGVFGELWYQPAGGGQASFVRNVCTGPSAPAAGGAPAGGVATIILPPPPPPPPTLEEIQRAVPFPVPGVGLNPPGDAVRSGLTGLDTWLWYEGDTTVSVSVSIRGYAVSATARAVRFVWTMGDGGWHESPIPGSEEAPAAEHLYETKGDYGVTLDVAWEGSYTFSGFGISESGALGTATVTGGQPNHVVEVWSALVTPEEERR